MEQAAELFIFTCMVLGMTFLTGIPIVFWNPPPHEEGLNSTLFSLFGFVGGSAMAVSFVLFDSPTKLSMFWRAVDTFTWHWAIFGPVVAFYCITWFMSASVFCGYDPSKEAT